MLLVFLLLIPIRLGPPGVWVPAPPVAPFTHGALPQQKVIRPLIFPVLGKSRWGRHYGLNYAYTRHTGIDIAAPKMTPIVASFEGILGFKRNSYWIYGTNGWILLGTHLNNDNIGRNDNQGNRDVMFAPNLVPGMTVKAGQLIGYVGDSGMATGPHLHFELYAPGDGPTQARIRDPFPSLKRAQVLKVPRIDLPDWGEKPKKGYLRLQACVRVVNPKANAIQVILVAKQSPKGGVTVVTRPRYVSLKLSERALDDLGGWDTLSNMASTRTVGLYIPWRKNLSGAKVAYALPSPTIR